MVCAALILGFTAFSAGGVTQPQWNIALAATCLLSFAVLARRAVFARPAVDVLLLLIPAYVALQLIPLPLGWVTVIAPARAALQTPLAKAGIASSHASLTASASLTTAHLMRVLCFICFFFIVRELATRFAKRPRTVALVAIPVVMIGLSEAVLGLAQFFGGAVHATGTWVNPNHYACFLDMALPFPAAFAAIVLRHRDRQTGLAPGRVLLACACFGASLVILLGELYSLSRMGAAAAGVSLFVFAVAMPWALQGSGKTSRRFGKPAASLAAVAVLLLFLAAPGPLLQRLSDEPGQTVLTGDVRYQIWRETLRMSADYPIFGSGLGTYASVFQKYRASVPAFLVDFAHNDYLQLLAELGIAGFVLLAAAATAILAGVVRAIRAGPTGAHRLLAAASLAALTAFLLDISVDFDFYIPANAIAAAWIAGLGSGSGRRYASIVV